MILNYFMLNTLVKKIMCGVPDEVNKEYIN